MLDLVAVGTKGGFGLKMKLDEMGWNHGFQDKVIKVSKDAWMASSGHSSLDKLI